MLEEKLIKILSVFGYPVFRQGSLAEDEDYPDSFFTFWNRESDDHTHYDNSEYGIEWGFDVNFYCNDPEKTYSEFMKARKELKNNGWIISGKGYDVASDEITHTGRGMHVYFLEI